MSPKIGTGSQALAKATSEHRGKRLAIVFNGKVISAPIIQSKISTKAVITGNFTKEEVEDIVKAIMKPKEDARKKEEQPKTSKPDSDDTSAIKKDGSSVPRLDFPVVISWPILSVRRSLLQRPN